MDADQRLITIDSGQFSNSDVIAYEGEYQITVEGGIGIDSDGSSNPSAFFGAQTLSASFYLVCEVQSLLASE